ncbi:hypothetical protein CHLRE_12g523340v5 [Chlamydomonas reinhardtii]|uniref:Uncharacterized protein n=1 Tax=Chlamydomonas reinhardtii TaxID=3055 RepID=A0A2K3D4A1_CHLRE|nr:uncharacterized protein CHLRE_12g523340v5 [Chlamydomonas reinhardtii]PNW75347.1 hypothetical protein CHLRE_12g523340v5 [Chlamydomonas reinhardtii]
MLAPGRCPSYFRGEITTVREVLDKSKALQARYGRQLAERVELVKKGSTMGEISRKLAPGQEAPEAARRELKNAIDTVFGAY